MVTTGWPALAVWAEKDCQGKVGILMIMLNYEGYITVPQELCWSVDGWKDYDCQDQRKIARHT